MNHFVCAHIEGSPDAQRRRAEAKRRWEEAALAKVRESRWGDLTPEERGWILATLTAASPEA